MSEWNEMTRCFYGLALVGGFVLFLCVMSVFASLLDRTPGEPNEGEPE